MVASNIRSMGPGRGVPSFLPFCMQAGTGTKQQDAPAYVYHTRTPRRRPLRSTSEDAWAATRRGAGKYNRYAKTGGAASGEDTRHVACADEATPRPHVDEGSEGWARRPPRCGCAGAGARERGKDQRPNSSGTNGVTSSYISALRSRCGLLPMPTRFLRRWRIPPRSGASSSATRSCG